MSERYIAFDVETPNYANDRISAIGISVIENGCVTSDFYTLVNPEAHFDPFNIQLTGITPEMVADKPTFPELWEKIQPIMDSGLLIAHNAPFDMGVLAQCLNVSASIDRGIGKAEPKQDDPAATPAQPQAPRMTDFKPYLGRTRKPGTGCISEINDHLFEGRYSPVWPDGKKHARNVYAKTREECEEKLKVLIMEMKKEIAAAKGSKIPDSIPDGMSKKKNAIAAYMRANPQVTNKALIATESGISRSTVVKYYDEIRRTMAAE